MFTKFTYPIAIILIHISNILPQSYVNQKNKTFIGLIMNASFLVIQVGNENQVSPFTS